MLVGADTIMVPFAGRGCISRKMTEQIEVRRVQILLTSGDFIHHYE